MPSLHHPPLASLLLVAQGCGQQAGRAASSGVPQGIVDAQFWHPAAVCAGSVRPAARPRHDHACRRHGALHPLLRRHGPHVGGRGPSGGADQWPPPARRDLAQRARAQGQGHPRPAACRIARWPTAAARGHAPYRNPPGNRARRGPPPLAAACCDLAQRVLAQGQGHARPAACRTARWPTAAACGQAPHRNPPGNRARRGPPPLAAAVNPPKRCRLCIGARLVQAPPPRLEVDLPCGHSRHVHGFATRPSR